MPSRRDILKLGVGGLLASACPSFADEPRKGGMLYVLVLQMKIGDKTVPYAVLSVDPESGVWQLASEDTGGQVRISPDGKSIIHWGTPPTRERGLYLSAMGGEGESRRVSDVISRGLWSADPKKFLISEKDKSAWMVSTDGKTRTKMPFPDHIDVLDWSRDGKCFLLSSREESKDPKVERPLLIKSVVDETGKVAAVLTRPRNGQGKFNQTSQRFTADSSSVVYLSIEKEDPKNPIHRLKKIGIDGKNDRVFYEGTEKEAPMEACFSPDNRRAAIVLYDPTPADNGRTPLIGRTLEITDADGKNGRKIEIPGAPNIQLLNWI